MTRLLAFASLVMFGPVLCACSSGAKPQPIEVGTSVSAPSASPTTAPPLTIGAAEPARGFPWDAHGAQGANLFIYDIVRDAIQPIYTNWNYYGQTWISDDEVLLYREDDAVALALDGQIREVPSLPRSPLPDVIIANSPYGWRVEARPQSTIVFAESGTPAFEITGGVQPFLWRGRNLVFRGHGCFGDTMRLDVDSGELSVLSDETSAFAPPIPFADDPIVTIATYGRDGGGRAMSNVDVETSARRQLFALDGYGTVGPLAWNSDESQLLVRFSRKGNRACRVTRARL